MIKLINGRVRYKRLNPSSLNGLARRKIALKENKEKIQFNLSVLDNKEELKSKYPNLYKIINRMTTYLYDINEYSNSKMIGQKKNGLYYFFVSSRFLESYFKYGKYNTWNRNINIFCTIGLINKYNVDDIYNIMVKRAAKKMRKLIAINLGLAIDKVNDINFYTIPKYDSNVLENADSICGKLIQNRFRVSGFSKIFLIKAFGEEFANNVFDDNRHVTEYSNYVANYIETSIISEISKKGYTTKNDIIKIVKNSINVSKITTYEYGFYNNDLKGIVEREFTRSIADIANRIGLEYRKANKELLKKYDLKTYKYIIYKSKI